MSILTKIFGSQNDREIKKLDKLVDEIEALEPKMQALSDEELRSKTDEFKTRLADGETLDDLLTEAFAVVREASRRILGMRHFKVQLVGGIVLHQGRIAEMKTGEGKTLVATLPVYLNALEGKGVHVVTVNDYLATRDSQWMGKVYNFLGLSVGLIVHGLDHSERQQAYNSDITYGTNNEFGFDYLRDNMVIYKEQMVQRELNFAIVDEVDSILIDEARTPLIISGVGEKSTHLYYVADNFVKTLKRGADTKDESKAEMLSKYFEGEEEDEETIKNKGDYSVDPKAKTVILTEAGVEKAERFFGVENLADPENMEIQHHINQALKARALMNNDIDYVVKDGEVIIVDEFTGRLMYGRRYSDGLHQAIEAKEGVKIERESQTLATITFQNYFRMYQKLAGMTGTAKTEEDEFRAIYNLDVVEIPTNKPMIREDHPDVIYKNEKGKFNAVVNEIAELHGKGRPILVGTISIEKSELLSSMLKKRGIPHEVLNAKYHEKEAEIIAKAGQMNALTISTNMAGRGTDIVLGEGVKELGGLHIIGTERHESRRIDNQLRGRAGRQGDLGSSRFYISLEDDLMKLFGSDKIMNLMETIGMEEDMPIEHGLLTKAIENAQKKVESRNFDIRKHVLQYDNVMNKQREVIYAQRRQVLMGEDIKDSIMDMLEEVVSDAVNNFTVGSQYPEEWDIAGLLEYLQSIFLPKRALKVEDISGLTKEELNDVLMDRALKLYEAKEAEVGSENMRELERVILLKVVDSKWMDHLDAMDQLRDGINLRAFGQQDPVQAYQIEGYDMFLELIKNIRQETIKYIYSVNVNRIPQREQVAEEVSTNQEQSGGYKPVVKEEKIGRNDPCPCGSGKKYKKCCGRNEN
ncbi:preprotein translocase subunit SecA [Lutispora saccharofermentans]|uniref:Protein translocase subunit SecA n=1 Tax=Lutispora saccharofermentans TaxID=3024236 RepID=A0ABT1NBL8_9FIRM|nr:preprotein translocase subunit SecA [Lutispora saccharofermentans]MCQ1528635.1 preprotein translocase subunit SecA [Lutispora saccharofermentans]